jgi:hypothetical protein
MASFVFQGTSGVDYTYLLLPLDPVTLLPLQAGNYILATGSATHPRVVLVDCAEGIRKAIQTEMVSKHWATATDIYGVTLLYVHIDPSGDGMSRLKEKIDLIDAYHPPMNR